MTIETKLFKFRQILCQSLLQASTIVLVDWLRILSRSVLKIQRDENHPLDTVWNKTSTKMLVNKVFHSLIIQWLHSRSISKGNLIEPSKMKSMKKIESKNLMTTCWSIQSPRQHRSHQSKTSYSKENLLRPKVMKMKLISIQPVSFKVKFKGVKWVISILWERMNKIVCFRCVN